MALCLPKPTNPTSCREVGNPSPHSPSPSMAGAQHEPVLYPPSRPTPSTSTSAANASSGNSNRWGPYHSASDFSATMALVLLILVCTLVVVLAFTAAVRFFRRRRHPPPSTEADVEKQEPAGKHATLAFTAGMELAGSAAECAICLAEFAEGEGVRVLPACNHGFHVKCIEAWLASKPSCPTCRSSCQVACARPPGKLQPSPSEMVQ